MRMQDPVIVGVALLFALGLVVSANAQEKSITVIEEIVTMEDLASSPTQDIVAEALAVGPTKEDLGKESEEPETPETLFRTEDDIRQLLGERPTFVYDPRNLPDPMIIPWVRREVIVGELIEMAKENIKEGELQKAKKYLEQVLKEFPTSNRTTEARAELNRVQKMLDEGYGPEGVRQPRVVLPAWVASHTVGVIVDQDNPAQSVVLVGDSILKVGDQVPNYEGVVVDKIEDEKVTYRYNDKTFPVVVEAQ
jgi:hypothetical protein